MYPADDVKVHPKRISKQPKITKLRKSITPGTVLIVLAGRFKGRRVVFLKQLKSGMLLITGPYEINGVPLRRINQAYCIPTSTKFDISKLNINSIDDSYFKKSKAKKEKVTDKNFFVKVTDKTEEDLKRIQEKK